MRNHVARDSRLSNILRVIFLVDLFQGLWVTFRNQHPKNICTRLSAVTNISIAKVNSER